MKGLQKHGLIVSCQALEDEPLHGGDTMTKMAIAAEQAGAVGIRANGVHDIRSIKQAVKVPVIGLIKRHIPGSAIFITPTIQEVQDIIAAGADVVALDVTDREGRLNHAAEFIHAAHEAGVSVMADVSTFEEGVAAARLGADYIGTTLSGYTPYSAKSESPDIYLVRKLSEATKVPIISEGRIWTPNEAAMAMEAGAAYVVVGSAITRPRLIAARYAAAVHPFTV